MNLAQYLAQNEQKTQGTQEAQEAQEKTGAQETQPTALTADMIAAKLAAEKYYSLQVQTEEAIANKEPPAEILLQMVSAIFGASSTQYLSVSENIDGRKHPGGREMAISSIRQRKRLLKQQQESLEARVRTIAREIQAATDEERAILNEKDNDNRLNEALTAVLEFCKATAGTDPQPEIVQSIQSLYARYHETPAAMGLLYGCISEFSANAYSSGKFNLIDLQGLSEIKEKILSSM